MKLEKEDGDGVEEGVGSRVELEESDAVRGKASEERGVDDVTDAESTATAARKGKTTAEEEDDKEEACVGLSKPK